MENIAEHLKNVKVLDNSDIIRFKNYISNKYPKNTSVKNARVLSDAIHKVIYGRLEGLPEEFKLPIKTNVLKNTFGKDKSLITLYDIFDCCLIDENLRNNFRDHLVKWVNLHVKINIKVSDLGLYIDTLDIRYRKTVDVLEKNIYIENEEKIISNDIIIDKQESIKATLNNINILTYLSNLRFGKITALLAVCIFTISLYSANKNLYTNINNIQSKEERYIFEKEEKHTFKKEEKHIYQADKSASIETEYPNSNLPEYLRYKAVNEEKLKNFLDKHNSFLVKEPYFSTIISVSKEFNLNPIMLFSITGQEQSFVPKNNYNASEIANNPFNVYHSWREYNTNIRDSSSIAARTLINISQNIPKNEDPFLWIGERYAEDRFWGNGVKSLFEELNEYVD